MLFCSLIIFRGEISDRGTYNVETDNINQSIPKNIPTYSDILIGYASVPGNFK